MWDKIMFSGGLLWKDFYMKKMEIIPPRRLFSTHHVDMF